MENDYPFVSVIIPVRNVEKIIGQCLKSLNRLNYPGEKYEVIVADSESNDATQSIARKYGAIVVSTPQKSICAGRNEGFKAARGEIIAFSDADCVMDKDWLKNSLKYFRDPTIGAVGGPNISPAEDMAFAKAVSFVFDQALFSAGSIHGRFLKKTKEVASIPGCNAIYRKIVLDQVLPMAETLAEDYVMNQLIRRLGYRLVYTPDTIVWHYRRATPWKFFKQMSHYAVCRLSIGKKDSKMINLMHITVGLGWPIFIGLSLFLLFLNPLWYLYFISLITLFLASYFLLAWFKLKSLKTALRVPFIIVILFSAWSTGFLKELFFPFKSRA